MAKVDAGSNKNKVTKQQRQLHIDELGSSCSFKIYRMIR